MTICTDNLLREHSDRSFQGPQMAKDALDLESTARGSEGHTFVCIDLLSRLADLQDPSVKNFQLVEETNPSELVLQVTNLPLSRILSSPYWAHLPLQQLYI